MNVMEKNSWIENILLPSSNASLGNQLFGGLLVKISQFFKRALFIYRVRR